MIETVEPRALSEIEAESVKIVNRGSATKELG